MRKNYHCIKLTDEVEMMLMKYMKDHNTKISESINKLILDGIMNDCNMTTMTSITDGIEKILSKTFYLKILMEQLYSDFNIDVPSDPKNSIGLKIVKERLRKSFDD